MAATITATRPTWQWLRMCLPFQPGIALWGVCLAVLTSPAFAAEQSLTQYPLRPIVPNPGLVAYATRHGIPLDGIQFAATDSPRPGDETIFLLSLQQGQVFKQWLVRLTAAELDPRKEENKPLPEEIIFTSTGLELHYVNTPTALSVEFIGPFGPNQNQDTVTAKQARAVVSAESLQLGIEPYCRTGLEIAGRLSAAEITKPIYYGGSRQPAADAIAAGRAAAAAFALTAEEERLAFSVYFSLRAFFEAATGIPACREVLEQVLQKPSLWSVVGNFGVNTGFDYGWQKVNRAPETPLNPQTPAYLLPVRISLNNQPAVNATLAVSSSRPPLRNCAGIVALCAEHPVDQSKRLFLQLLAAHPAKLQSSQDN